MHSSAIADYQARGLLEPLDPTAGRIGITPDQFTKAAHAGVMVDGQAMGLPIDVWAPLWHINMNLFRKAGLVAGRQADPAHQARRNSTRRPAQFQARTGKPYLIQVTDKDYSGPMRIFYVYVMQQGGPLFRDARPRQFRQPRRPPRAASSCASSTSAATARRIRTMPGPCRPSSRAKAAWWWTAPGWSASSTPHRADAGRARCIGGYAVRPIPFIFSGKQGVAGGWAQLGHAAQRTAHARQRARPR